uniref:SprT-like family protein n=1 Tax=Myoviridae sp. ctJ2i1 TaxID=2825079 RepID=A0A8S5V1L3_9CAUD|nr:MAG TPA: SprT-like family protein [Myoviridae sp. ctJ2i1]
MEVYYDTKLRKKWIKILDTFIYKYSNSCNLDILICETNKKDIYGEAIFDNKSALIKINFNTGDIEDTFIHELAHCISQERSHKLIWRRCYRKLKGINNE